MCRYWRIHRYPVTGNYLEFVSESLLASFLVDACDRRGGVLDGGQHKSQQSCLQWNGALFESPLLTRWVQPGHLVSIANEDENKFARQTLSYTLGNRPLATLLASDVRSEFDVWIGATDRDTEDRFKWVGGQEAGLILADMYSSWG